VISLPQIIRILIAFTGVMDNLCVQGKVEYTIKGIIVKAMFLE
jgi:hypothetical protein